MVIVFLFETALQVLEEIGTGDGSLAYIHAHPTSLNTFTCWCRLRFPLLAATEQKVRAHIHQGRVCFHRRFPA